MPGRATASTRVLVKEIVLKAVLASRRGKLRAKYCRAHRSKPPDTCRACTPAYARPTSPGNKGAFGHPLPCSFPAPGHHGLIYATLGLSE